MQHQHPRSNLLKFDYPLSLLNVYNVHRYMSHIRNNKVVFQKSLTAGAWAEGVIQKFVRYEFVLPRRLFEFGGKIERNDFLHMEKKKFQF